MNSSPVVSIFCSIFKGEKYIQHYLHDITRQSIFDKCELILVDGNSPENEEGFVKEFQKEYSNINYIKLNEDPGLYACWNIAVKQARGKYLNNANPDDGKHPMALEEQVAFLEDNPKVDLVYTDSLITRTENQIFETCFSRERYDFPSFSIEDLIIYNMPHQSPVYKNNLHERFGFFKEDYKSAADGEFWLRCATKGAILAKLDKILGLYYFNPEGVSTGKEVQRRRQYEERKVKEKYAKIQKYDGPLYGKLEDIIVPHE